MIGGDHTRLLHKPPILLSIAVVIHPPLPRLPFLQKRVCVSGSWAMGGGGVHSWGWLAGLVYEILEREKWNRTQDIKAEELFTPKGYGQTFHLEYIFSCFFPSFSNRGQTAGSSHWNETGMVEIPHIHYPVGIGCSARKVLLPPNWLLAENQHFLLVLSSRRKKYVSTPKMKIQ